MSTVRVSPGVDSEDKIESGAVIIDLRDCVPTPYGSDLEHSRQWESWE